MALLRSAAVATSVIMAASVWEMLPSPLLLSWRPPCGRCCRRHVCCHGGLRAAQAGLCVLRDRFALRAHPSHSLLRRSEWWPALLKRGITSLQPTTLHHLRSARRPLPFTESRVTTPSRSTHSHAFSAPSLQPLCSARRDILLLA